MIDKSKHRYWKGQLISCPRCEHRMSVEDYKAWHNMCPFCGKVLKPADAYNICTKDELGEIYEESLNVEGET